MTQTLIPVYHIDTEEDKKAAAGLPQGIDGVFIVGFRGATRIKSWRHNATAEKSIAVQINPSRRTITIKNNGANDVFIGGEDVTVDNGYLMSATDAITLELSGELYCITVSTTERLDILSEVDA